MKIKIWHIPLMVAGLVLLYTLAGFFLVPWAGQNILIPHLERVLGRPVAIESVAMNPLRLTFTLQGLEIKEKTQEMFISIPFLFVELSGASLLNFRPEITRFDLESPVVNLVLKPDKRYNFSDLLKDPLKTPEDPSPAKGRIFGFKLANARIINGKLSFTDQLRNQTHHIEKLNLNLPLLTSLEEEMLTRTRVDVDFFLNQTQINLHLESVPFHPSRDSQFTLKTQALDLKKFLAYLPLPDLAERLLVEQMEGFLDLSLAYTRKKDKPSLILKGSAGLANIDIQDADKTKVLAIPKINVTLAPSDLLTKKVTVKTLTIDSPQLNLSRNDQGQLNLLTYLPQPQTEKRDKSEKQTPGKPNPRKKSPGFSFQVTTAEIKEGRLAFTDAATPTPFHTVLFPVSIQVKELVAGRGTKGKFAVSLETEAAETLVSQGLFSISPLKIEGSVRLARASLPKYAPYYGDQIHFDLQEGQLQLEGEFSLAEQENEIGMVVRTQEIGLSQIALWDRVNQETPVKIPELKIQGALLDTRKKRLDLGQVTASQGRILLKRQADGSLNLVKNFMAPALESAPSAESALSAQAPPQEASGPGQGSDPETETGSWGGAEPSPPPQVSGSSWEVSLESLGLEAFSLAFTDATPQEAVSIDLSDIRFWVDNLKTGGKEPLGIDAAMVWNDQGKIQVKGSVLPPFQAGELDLSLDKIDIQSLEPYFTDQVRIKVQNGQVQTQGQLIFSLAQAPQVSFKGEASLTQMALLDKETDKDLFHCTSLYLSEMDLSLFPLRVAVEEISLTDFYSRIILSDKGEINLKQVFTPVQPGEPIEKKDPVSSPPPQALPAEEKPQPLPEIHIGKVTLQGGHINFTDYLTQPNFTAQMKEIAGGITQLSSSSLEPSQIRLQGVHGHASPLEIVGRIRPLTREKFFEMDVVFKNIELVKFSPYSAKYMGYKIEKGKLILDLKYKIEGNKLESKNRLVFDQLTLGERVESKDATSLPVGLAITLLKDSKDQINLELPVTGNLNDPKFNFSSAVVAAIGNTITKVVTAPFAILGSLFGGGKELGFVEFDHGSPLLKETGIEKLDQLIPILSQKKQLKLEIEGTYHRVRDGEALRKIRYETLLKSEKQMDLVAQGRRGSALQELIVDPGEREALIHSAYAKAGFPKPRAEDGTEKNITVEEKGKLLLTNISVTDQDLETLAMSRAEAIRTYILSTAQVEPQRLFLRSPDSVESDSKESEFSRVNFSLRQ